LMLEDNGCGFLLAEAGSKGFGNGLANMRRRLAKIGGRFEIEPVPAKGTKVTFIVKLVTASNG
jgi:signal transduction histidine kinase